VTVPASDNANTTDCRSNRSAKITERPASMTVGYSELAKAQEVDERMNINEGSSPRKLRFHTTRVKNFRPTFCRAEFNFVFDIRAHIEHLIRIQASVGVNDTCSEKATRLPTA
jgi:hypothetical protein